MSKVIIFPTDTVYGIGASVYDKDGIEKIYKIKNRPHDKPLAVLCASVDQMKDVAILSDFALKLVETYMPGALTIIVPSQPKIKEAMGLDMVGVRIPNSKIARAILEENGPMATTSVNESGQKPLNEFEIIEKEYHDKVDKIYSSDEESSNVASTVIMITGDSVKLIREGKISYKDIMALK